MGRGKVAVSGSEESVGQSTTTNVVGGSQAHQKGPLDEASVSVVGTSLARGGAGLAGNPVGVF